MNNVIPRVQKLRDAMLAGEHVKYRGDLDSSIVSCADPYEPIIVRRAKALKKLLEEMPIYILPHEVIVGGRTVIRKFPQYATEQERKEAICRVGGWFGMGHCVPNYHKALALGLEGITEICQEKIRILLSKEIYQGDSVNFYQAVCIAAQGVMNLARRYSEKAISLALKEKDPPRRKELEKIAAVCDRVPANPPRNFHEALQFVWFVHIALNLESYMISFGRFDQYMYPFYRKDIDSGRLTVDEAEELLMCFWIKTNTTTDSPAEGVFPGDNCQQITLGGQIREGEDATNDLTYLCLKTTMKLQMQDPKITIRVNRDSPQQLIDKACHLIRLGLGFPNLHNDEVIIPALQNVGFSLEDARDYCANGCWEPTSQGRSITWPQAMTINLVSCIEFVLNSGNSLLAFQDEEGIYPKLEQDSFASIPALSHGIDMGDLSQFTDFEEFIAAWEEAVKFCLQEEAKKCIRLESYLHKMTPTPLLSSLMEDCVDKGKDQTQGGARYNFVSVAGIGFANSVDSLAAIKKFVFEEKKISLSQLVQILKDNFEDYPEILLELRNRCPKFGNDDDYVDSIAIRVADFFCKEVKKHRNSFGRPFLSMFNSGAYYVTTGKVAGASANGRKAKEPFVVNFSVSIQSNGPTAAIRSVTKIDHTQIPSGGTFHLSFTPAAFGEEEDLRILQVLLKAYWALGGSLLAVDLADPQVLREAQQHPESYPHLMVRVWGWSAKFVSLSKEFQDHIISRLSGS